MKILSTLIVLSIGFSALSAKADNVALVDIDKVAEQLGYMEFIQSTLQSKGSGLTAELNKAKADLQSQLDEALSKLGTSPSVEQQNRFRTFSIDLNGQYDRKVAQSNQVLLEEQVKLIREFQEAIKPIALAEAKKKNCTIVFNIISPPVFTFEATADITNDVAEAAKKAGLTKGDGKGKGK